MRSIAGPIKSLEAVKMTQCDEGQARPMGREEKALGSLVEREEVS